MSHITLRRLGNVYEQPFRSGSLCYTKRVHAISSEEGEDPLRAMVRVLAGAIISVAAVCLLTVSQTSALSLSSLLRDVTQPLTNLIQGEEPSTAPAAPNDGSNGSSPKPVGEQDEPDRSKGEVAPVSGQTAVSSDPELAPLPTPSGQTASQVAPPPNTSLPPHSRQDSSEVLASTFPVTQTDGAAGGSIQRTPNGWMIGGLLWYQWLVVVMSVAVAIISLKYQWHLIQDQRILSKK